MKQKGGLKIAIKAVGAPREILVQITTS